MEGSLLIFGLQIKKIKEVLKIIYIHPLCTQKYVFYMRIMDTELDTFQKVTMAAQKELDASRRNLEFCRIWASLKEQRYKIGKLRLKNYY